MIDWMKYRWLYLVISGTVILSGVFSLFKWGLKYGVDFTGGTLIEYKFPDGKSKTFKYPPMNDPELEKIRLDFKNQKAEEVRFENVGPSIGPELVKKTFIAIAISAGGILMWISLRFKSFKFGPSAVLGMLHDSLVLVGSFSILGHFLGVEVDFLFVTALLTILSFSVHDTIVNYDRIREINKKYGGEFYDIANKATSETMVRSLNNSFTIIFMLLALILLGGETIKWFAVALLIGTVSGTYSSPFVSVAILVTWDRLEKRFKKF
jgi:preprotein translocase subunit SecF